MNKRRLAPFFADRDRNALGKLWIVVWRHVG
jgi:hypothetical protein